MSDVSQHALRQTIEKLRENREKIEREGFRKMTPTITKRKNNKTKREGTAANENQIKREVYRSGDGQKLLRKGKVGGNEGKWEGGRMEWKKENQGKDRDGCWNMTPENKTKSRKTK